MAEPISTSPSTAPAGAAGADGRALEALEHGPDPISIPASPTGMDEPEELSALGAAAASRSALQDGHLRERTARGTIINSFFDIGLAGLGIVKNFVVAALLTASQYGIWGILVVALGTLVFIKQSGVGDKYVQQDETNQKLAFQKAFTLELIFCIAFGALIFVTTPIFAVIYGRPEILGPGFAVIIAAPAAAFQAPIWVFYRDMKFVRQRTLAIIDPLVGTIVTIALAVAGAGYWSLVIGLIVGTWAGAIGAIFMSPIPLRWRYERGSARSYVQFSWPLIVGGVSGIIIAQGAVLTGQAVAGLVGVGAITLASQVTQFTDGIDRIVTNTLYPAVCAIKDRSELMLEAFLKSNRLGLMWGVPFGVGVALFASDLVHFGLGPQWIPAIHLIELFGLVAAMNHIAYNWDAFIRAVGDTRPVAITGATAAVVFVLVGIPLILIFGLSGVGYAFAAMSLAIIVQRVRYLKRIFPGLRIIPHAARSIAPVVPGAVAVLVLRKITGPDSTLLVVFAQLALYALWTVAATMAMERDLINELLGYVRGRAVKPQVAV